MLYEYTYIKGNSFEKNIKLFTYTHAPCDAGRVRYVRNGNCFLISGPFTETPRGVEEEKKIHMSTYARGVFQSLTQYSLVGLFYIVRTFEYVCALKLKRTLSL